MKSISYWASHHLWPARILLFTAFVLLNLVAGFTGWALSDVQVHMPFYLVYLLLLPVVVAWLVYPQDRTVHNYYIRKKCEGITVAVTFLLIVCITNQRCTIAENWTPAWSNTAAEQKTQGASFDHHKKKPHNLTKKLKQKLADNLQVIRKLYQQGPKGVKYTLILLSVLAALGLSYLILVLSCHIACTGSGVLALAVYFLGTALVIFLTIRVFKAIQRKYLRDLRKRGNLPAKEPASLQR